MKKVALFTTFYEVESGYSLVAVAETQLRMLLAHGYDPVVLVQAEEDPGNPDPDITPEQIAKGQYLPGFTMPDAPSLWRPESVDIRPVVPALRLTGGTSEHFEERVQRIQDALRDALADIDVCITHDIILQSFYKEHNVAMRRYAETRPDLLWLNWVHSCPTPRKEKYPENCRHTPPPGYIVYPNASDLPRVCQAYKLRGMEWKAVANRSAHAIDPLAIWTYDRLTRDLVQRADLLAGDVAAVYPVRLDRGKQPEKILRLLAGVRRLGYVPRLLIVDWQSQGDRFQKYIDELIVLANGLHLQGAVNFTSRIDDRCSQGVPRHVVQELMDLGNVYIHPSRIETYGLTVHEAMLRGNLCVLNQDLPMMHELWGNDAIYFDFGSDRATRTYAPSEQTFWNDEAIRLMAELRQNRALMAQTHARQEWAPSAMWKEFAPLLGLPAVGA